MRTQVTSGFYPLPLTQPSVSYEDFSASPVPPERKTKQRLDILIKQKKIHANGGNECTVIGEQALWRAVITQALMDAGSLSEKRESKFHRAQAIAWLSRKNPDFQLVCALAGLEADYVFDKSRQAIKNECKWRKAPTTEQKNKR